MPGLRRFSQAISEGDGISLIVDVHSVDQARTAQTGGAEAIVLRDVVAGLSDATELPSLWCGSDSPEEALEAGAAAVPLVGPGGEELHTPPGRAPAPRPDCVGEGGGAGPHQPALQEVGPGRPLL